MYLSISDVIIFLEAATVPGGFTVLFSCIPNQSVIVAMKFHFFFPSLVFAEFFFKPDDKSRAFLNPMDS